LLAIIPAVFITIGSRDLARTEVDITLKAHRRQEQTGSDTEGNISGDDSISN